MFIYIYVPLRQPVKFLIDTGAQIPMISSLGAQKTEVKPSHLRVKITGFTSKSKICSAAKANYFLPGEKSVLRHQLAVVSGRQNVLGFDVLQARVWKLLDRRVLSFGCPSPWLTNNWQLAVGVRELG